MNVLHDPSRKTSINSLLNPQDGASFSSHLAPINPIDNSSNVVHSQGSLPAHYGSGFTSGNGSYSLRSATWDHEEMDKRSRPTNHQSQQRQYPSYPQSSIDHSQPPPMYPDRHSTRPEGRSDRPANEYGDSAHGWHRSGQAASAVAYSVHPSPTPYAEDRTGDYSQSGNYNNYRELSEPPQSWQAAERASVRLAARGTAPPNSRYSHSPPFMGRHDSDYATEETPTYPTQQIVSVTVPPAPQQEPTLDRTSTKRPLPDSEPTSAPKAKKVKEKGKATSSGGQAPSASSTGTSRRGYNAKKRQEAATIAAQNATAYHKAQGPEGEWGTNPDSFAERPTMALIPELQFARCMSNRYRNEEFTRCVSCTRRWAGDTCRFQGIRYFMRDSERRLLGISFKEHGDMSESSKMDFPKKWNRRIAREHTQRSKLSIAKALLPALKIEQQHMQSPELVRRQRETDVRVTCDTCMTSLFSTSFMCRLCGREVCNECFSTVKELTREPPDAPIAEKQRIQRMREKHVNANPFFLSCLKRNEHGYSDFTPVTRFVKTELDRAVAEMERILVKEEESLEETRNLSNQDSSSAESPSLNYSEYLANPHMSFPDPRSRPVYDDFTPSNAPERITSIPTHRAQVIPAALYDPRPTPALHTPTFAFSDLWKQGFPLLVKDLLPRFKVAWNPDYFKEKYGDSSCLIIECQTDLNRRVNVREFFSWFGQYEGRQECWKLKDWPPTAEFKTAFPELFDDFSNAVPVPDYVRRDGVYNIGSHFPTNAIGPDLGPKMYNSMATSQEPGSKGSTKLHMDMADALNVMLHSTACPDGTPGYAAWDLFKAEDSDKIRAFLRKKFQGLNGANSSKIQTSAEKAAALQAQQLAIHDPIHSQQFYLDVQLRRELFEEHGVKSFRIYQQPGEGVFIPAGCAHQVANMADCMKIAIDFVSPENIDRCENLTKEFREQNQLKAWKEDVLQLRTMMWFTWQSCTLREVEFDDDDSALGGDAMAITKR
ncbi:hypothetical protein CPB83DRAFT_795109 [Crepidotus variabilis]|uniref:JmjC domain-containing protein n=1 Tax=Crepidotus variabilis TaxID=179855 RepID=A0A9P6ECD3_9AGAR|nr:hypothetical protein CPB83DRAFT_795109 [Crepidotus variabilis]